MAFYPSPIASPFPTRSSSPFACDALDLNLSDIDAANQIVALKRPDNVYSSISLHSGARIAKNRRKSAPKRSIKQNSKSEFVVKLDVYTVFKCNPEDLVYSIKKERSLPPSPTMSDIAIPEPEPLKKKVDTSLSSTTNCYQGLRSPTFSKSKVDITNNGKSYHGVDPDFRIRVSDYTNTFGAPLPVWKGLPLNIPSSVVSQFPSLTPEELSVCRILRIVPDQYIHIKETLVSAVIVRGPYKKRDAQGWFRMDVNKTNKLYDWFKMLGWIPEFEEWDQKVEEMLMHHKEMDN